MENAILKLNDILKDRFRGGTIESIAVREGKLIIHTKESHISIPISSGKAKLITMEYLEKETTIDI